MNKVFRSLTAVVVSWLIASRPALACPVCFGASDDPQVQGSMWAIVALLGVTVGMLGAFATFFLHLRRRAKLATDWHAGKPPATPLSAQEGNV